MPHHTIKLNPLDIQLAHASLINQVLDQPAHRIISQRGGNRSVQSKAAFQGSSDVVFAATFPNPEFPRVSNPGFAGIKTEHNLSQSNQVPPALRFVSKIKHGSRV